MSFFSNNRTERCPGPITGNPLNGLCEKVCIHTQKVFDSCIKQVHIEDQNVTVTNFDPANPTLPLTFVGCTGGGTGTTIQNLTIDRFEDRPNFARISADVLVPITISYVDATGVPGTATGNIVIPEDVIMFVPRPSVIPFNIVALGSAVCSDGEFVNANTFNVDVCTTVILKVVVETDILVPSYGYCQIPQCQEYTEEVCAGTFDLPIYP